MSHDSLSPPETSVDVVCALRRRSLARELRRHLAGVEVTVVEPRTGGLDEVLRAGRPGVIVVDAALPVADAEAWVHETRALREQPEVVFLLGAEETSGRQALTEAGAVVLDPAMPVAATAATVRALVRRRVEDPHSAVEAASPVSRSRFSDFVSRSPRMQEFVRLARRFVDTDSSLLLLGETGTGKERLARALHEEGPRRGGPFVAVNCGGVPETLLESELFGFERGAFTGASRQRRGYFEQAGGGTLFLDEIGEVPIHLQVKLLRAIEQRQVQHLGGEHPLPVDIRVVAATNRDLEEDVEVGRFRRDLYYRLAVVTLTVPPLRERVEDIPALFASYVERFRVSLNRPVSGVEAAALTALCRHHWPGNVRELVNVAERAVLLAENPQIRLADLPHSISGLDQAGLPFGGVAAVATIGSGLPLREARRRAMRSFEITYLRQLLEETGGRVGEAARRAGINQRSLYELMRRHGIRKEDFRGG